MSHCMRHYEEPELARCRQCARPFCARCLVFSFGPDKPPFCVGCALTASGVRNRGQQVIVVEDAPMEEMVDRRAERAQRRAAKMHAKAEARAMKRAAKDGQPMAPPPAPEGPRPTAVPAPPGIATPASRYAPASPATERAVS